MHDRYFGSQAAPKRRVGDEIRHGKEQQGSYLWASPHLLGSLLELALLCTYRGLQEVGCLFVSKERQSPKPKYLFERCKWFSDSFLTSALACIHFLGILGWVFWHFPGIFTDQNQLQSLVPLDLPLGLWMPRHV